MTSTIWFSALASLAAVTVASTPAAAQQQQKPNILFIMGGLPNLHSAQFTQGVGLPSLEKQAKRG